MDRIKEHIDKEYNREEDGNSGVYMIRHKFTDRRYIGATKDFKKRFSDHCRFLRNGTHSNKALQEDFNRFRKEERYLEFSVIATCPDKFNNMLESYYTQQYTKEQLYSNNAEIYNSIWFSTNKDMWLNSIKLQYKIILSSFLSWYVQEIGYDNNEKYLVTHLIEIGVNEAKNGNLLNEYPYLKTKLLKKENIYDDTLDYLGLAIIYFIKNKENENCIYSREYKIQKDNTYGRCGLVVETVNKLNEIKGELGRLVSYIYQFGLIYADKEPYYDDYLDTIQILDGIMGIDNMLDCVYAYILMIFLDRNLIYNR